ncbi:thiamine phosphate synthase [Microbacterium capsulatum]|uniref:Thiamine-phosphate synthase n=1 Tax=Microbacterium capsulatum TaxID=3041921 RepID=A0ABU0XHS3_9MICO|nr:thiamine phosphate synthase [Microbacterium sp. ASV81]MDQ4214677.1 thiamine phosphate synthase [Microbacterium sp. ASV81]
MPAPLNPFPTRTDSEAAPAALGARRRELLADARLYLCTTARTATGDLEEFLDAAYAGGVDIVQLRDKGLEARAEIEALEILAAVARRHGKLFSVNDRADVAALVGADVFHVGQGDLTTAQARRLLGDDVILGRSTHSAGQAAEADADPGLDYFCVGPVWETPTKPGRAAVGLDPLRAVAATGTAKPWFAIGGVAAGARLDEVRSAGATRVVVVRAITEAEDPRSAAVALRAQLG